MFPTETCSSRKVQEVTCCQPATTVRLLVFMYIRALLYLIGGFFCHESNNDKRNKYVSTVFLMKTSPRQYQPVKRGVSFFESEN